MTFLGTNENVAKAQIWIAVRTSVLIAVIKKRLRPPHGLREVRQTLSLSMFEITLANHLVSPLTRVANGDYKPQRLVLP